MVHEITIWRKIIGTISDSSDDLPSESSPRPSSESNPIFSWTTDFLEIPQNALRRIYSQKRIHRDRSSMYWKIIKMQADLKKERLKSENSKKQYYRLLNAKQ